MTDDAMLPAGTLARVDGGLRVGAVLLAAGESTRFGSGNKLLAEVDGTPIVRQAAETVVAADLTDVVVIVGHDGAAVRDALTGLPVSVRPNPDYADGQSTSVRIGVTAARERGWDATVFALGDMPFVAPESINALLDSYSSGSDTVLAAAYDGERGNPVLFDRTHYGTLGTVSGDVGGRRLVENEGVLVDTGDPGVQQDIDDETDLSKYTD